MKLDTLVIQDSAYLERLIGDNFPIKADTPEKLLWCAVIARAFLDFNHQAKSYKPTSVDYSAYEFIFDDTGSGLRDILDHISDDTETCVEKFRKCATYLLETNQSLKMAKHTMAQKEG